MNNIGLYTKNIYRKCQQSCFHYLNFKYKPSICCNSSFMFDNNNNYGTRISSRFNQYIKYSPFSFNENVATSCSYINSFSSTCSIHTSVHFQQDQSDIPDYLIDSISEVEHLEEEQQLEEQENILEDEISDYLSSRTITFHESDSSYTVQCLCPQSKKTHGQDIFVDKHSGKTNPPS